MRFELPAFHTSETIGNKVSGVMIGIVTNNKDPDNLGRVKVKLPIREIEYETDWIRIATLMAGNDRGSLFIPEVEDEVLVAFHMGDINHPFVIGSLWNKKQSPPAGDENNEIRKIKTKHGHQILFHDNRNNASVTVETAGGNKIDLQDKNEKIIITDKSANNVITIQGGHSGSIEIKSSQTKIMINSQGDISLTSNKAVTIKSTNVKVESSATMEIKAGASLSLKAGAALDIKSDGLVNIKGVAVKIN